MISIQQLRTVPDDDLLLRLSALVRQSQRVEAELIAHIGEVDERRLFARRACSSMFAYATEVLHLSEAEAYLRISVARAARRFPALLLLLRDGQLHLSGIAVLAPHLTEANCDIVLVRAVHKSKRQIEELVAELAPKPDVPVTVRKLPAPPPPPQPAAELRPGGVGTAPAPRPPSPPTRNAPPAGPKPEPLSPDRFKIQFTASGELRDKLERLQSLLHLDLASVIEAAVTEKIERVEAKRYGETTRPRKTIDESDRAPRSRYIPAAVRRFVLGRDGRQCTYVDKNGGKRCGARQGLQFHHDDPYGRGGDHDPSRIRLLCRAHNLYQAERDYGKDVMDRFRRGGSRVSEPAPSYDVRRILGSAAPLRPDSLRFVKIEIVSLR
jgi:hypothetical protein